MRPTLSLDKGLSCSSCVCVFFFFLVTYRVLLMSFRLSRKWVAIQSVFAFVTSVWQPKQHEKWAHLVGEECVGLGGEEQLVLREMRKSYCRRRALKRWPEYWHLMQGQEEMQEFRRSGLKTSLLMSVSTVRCAPLQ